MLDISSPVTWLWAASVLVFSLVLFKRRALLFWLMVIPPLAALKLGVPVMVIAAGVGAMLVGLVYRSFFTEETATESSVTLKSEETGQQISFHLRLPLGPSIALIIVLNIGLALLLLQFFDPDVWFSGKNIPGKFTSMLYVIFGFFSALVISMLFVTTTQQERR